MAKRGGKRMGAVVFLFPSQSQFSHWVNEDFLRIEDRTVCWLRPTCCTTSVCLRLSCRRSAVRVVVLTCTARGQGWDYTVGGLVSMSLPPARECLYQSQVLIESVNCSVWMDARPSVSSNHGGELLKVRAGYSNRATPAGWEKSRPSKTGPSCENMNI